MRDIGEAKSKLHVMNGATDDTRSTNTIHAFTEKFYLVYWPDEDLVSVVPEKDVD